MCMRLRSVRNKSGVDLKIKQEYRISLYCFVLFLYNFIEKLFLKGYASINTSFIDIAFH